MKVKVARVLVIGRSDLEVVPRGEVGNRHYLILQ